MPCYWLFLVEIVAETYHGWPYDLYLRLPLRYLFAVALGVWLGMDGKPNRVLLAAGALVGLVTLYTTIYLDQSISHARAFSYMGAVPGHGRHEAASRPDTTRSGQGLIPHITGADALFW